MVWLAVASWGKAAAVYGAVAVPGGELCERREHVPTQTIIVVYTNPYAISVGWLIGFIIIDQGFERTRQQSQNVYKNRDSCLVVLVDLFAVYTNPYAISGRPYPDTKYNTKI